MGLGRPWVWMAIGALTAGPVTALAQEGAVEALRAMDGAAGAAAPAGGSGAEGKAWADALRAARSADGQAPPSPTGEVASSPESAGPLGLGLAALAVAVAGAAGFFAGQLREQRGAAEAVAAAHREAAAASQKAARAAEEPPARVRVRAVRSIEGHGDLLVVDVEGESLVLYLGASREEAHRIARLGEELPDLDWQLDRVAERVVTALRAGPPAQAMANAAAAIPREPVSAPVPRAPGQDEDLDVLLDELLGKVRDLKPLHKPAADES